MINVKFSYTHSFTVESQKKKIVYRHFSNYNITDAFNALDMFQSCVIAISLYVVVSFSTRFEKKRKWKNVEYKINILVNYIERICVGLTWCYTVPTIMQSCFKLLLLLAPKTQKVGWEFEICSQCGATGSV